LGAPLKKKDEVIESTKSPQKNQKYLDTRKTNFENEEMSNPKIINAVVERIKSLTKLIGSKLWDGEIANETAGPAKSSTQEIRLIINS